MSLLEDAIQKQQNLINKGYERQVIMTAAAIVLAEKVDQLEKTMHELAREIERSTSVRMR